MIKRMNIDQPNNNQSQMSTPDNSSRQAGEPVSTSDSGQSLTENFGLERNG